MKAFETEQDFTDFRVNVEGTAVSYEHQANGSAIVICSDGVKLLVSPNGDSRVVAGDAKTYTIQRSNGDRSTATDMSDALAIARRMLGVDRIYRGAEYQTDRPGKGDERESCTALDIWTSRSAARRESGACADVVISW